MHRQIVPIPRAPITNQLNLPTPPIVGLEPPPCTLQQNRLQEHPSRDNRRKDDPASRVLGTVQVTEKSSEISEHVQEPQAGTSGVPVVNVTAALKVNRTTVVDQFIVSLMNNKEYCHKFIIHDGAFFEKDDLLKSLGILEFTTEFIPIMFQNEGTTSTFLARDCFCTIHKLVRSGFTIRLLGNYDQNQKPVFLSVEVILCDTPATSLGVSVHADVTKCVAKRYNSRLKCLNLSNFHNDPDLQKLYCPLWLPSMLHFVLTRGVAMGITNKAVNNCIQSILLSNNGLTTTRFLGMRHELKIKGVKMFDLSNNKLERLDALVAMQPLKLTELVLDNNPLCGKFTDEASYVKNVLSVLPTLKKLDGVYLVQHGVPFWRRNYVVSEEGIELVDQFLEHYFTLYDSNNRQKMQDLYHDEACFSMSACYLPGQSTSLTARLTCYSIESRNLLKLSDYSKNYTLLSHGSKNVVTTLSRLPRTEHDPYSFAVDLSQYTPNHAVITVSGVFRESSTMNKWAVRSFNRTFVLLKVSNVQYVITNEILLISNATTGQAEESFQLSPPNVCMTKMALCIFENLTLPEKRHITNILAQLTEMNPHWARKCLEESKWNIREALQVFTELYKMNKIPAEAFVRD